jgi:archaellum component FlaC
LRAAREIFRGDLTKALAKNATAGGAKDPKLDMQIKHLQAEVNTLTQEITPLMTKRQEMGLDKNA